MATAARASGPETRRAQVVTATRAPTIFLNNSNASDNANALRRQRLRLLGIIGRRADLLAALAWETSHA